MLFRVSANVDFNRNELNDYVYKLCFWLLEISFRRKACLW